MRTIAVVNQKGGCGKTTTSINLAGFLAKESRRVLLVDMDPQGHATLGLSSGAARPTKTVYDLLAPDNGSTGLRIRDITISLFENLDLAPADILLSAVPEKLASVPGRENVLSKALSEVSEQYDYIVIDCPPNVGLLTFNALIASTEAIVPIDPSFFSLHGLAKLLETFDVLKRRTGHEVATRALVTLYTGRSQFVRDVVDEIRQHLSGRHFETVIRHSVKLAEAASHGLPISTYCTHCAGFDDYRALAREVMSMEASMPAGDFAASEPAAQGGDRPSAPILTPEGVLFTIEAPDAGRVQLAGDFNEWALDGSEMSPEGNLWKTVVKLEPGRYRYRYVVDGRWITDPLNAEVEPAPYGEQNSVFVLQVPPAE
jgi:chromosome partitioning protein